MVLGLAGSLLRLLDPSNVWLCLVSACMNMAGFCTFYGFAGAMVIECMGYGEWKTGVRVEGAMGSFQSVMNKVGNGLGTAIPDVILAARGYDGTLAAQPSSALSTILAFTTWIPAIFYLIFLVCCHFYDLEKNSPASGPSSGSGMPPLPPKHKEFHSAAKCRPVFRPDGTLFAASFAFSLFVPCRTKKAPLSPPAGGKSGAKRTTCAFFRSGST